MSQLWLITKPLVHVDDKCDGVFYETIQKVSFQIMVWLVGMVSKVLWTFGQTSTLLSLKLRTLCSFNNLKLEAHHHRLGDEKYIQAFIAALRTGDCNIKCILWLLLQGDSPFIHSQL